MYLLSSSGGCWREEVPPLPQCHLSFFHSLHWSIVMKDKYAYKITMFIKTNYIHLWRKFQTQNTKPTSYHLGGKAGQQNLVIGKCVKRNREHHWVQGKYCSWRSVYAHAHNLQCWAIQCIWMCYNDLFSNSLETKSTDLISRIYRNL